jgi:hypothetical protein
MNLRTVRFSLPVLLALASLTCSGDGDLSQADRQPSAIEQIAGDGQVGLINQMLPDPLVVEVIDSKGSPIGGVTVTWAAQGGGTLSETSVVTGDDGRAAVRRTLGTTSGQVTTTAQVSSLPAVTFISTAQDASAPRLVIVTQPSSSAQSGVALAQQPVVRIEDGQGQPPSQSVQVTAAVQGATLSGTTTVGTDNSGVATFTNLVLAGAAGNYTLTFSAPNVAAAQSDAIALTSGGGGGGGGGGGSATTGEWTAPFDWPIVAIHMMLLPNGKVLSIGRTGTPQVWDPASGNFTPMPAPAWLFCAGHSLLADGRVLVAGGHISDGHGLPNISLFDASSGWTSSVQMAKGRWYPTATTMGNGDVVITAGTDQDSLDVLTPEVWSNGSIRELSGAQRLLSWYPRAFLVASGELYVAGGAQQTFFLSTNGTGSWRTGPKRQFGGRNYGSAVMYDDQKILYAGGAFSTNTAETIDLGAASPRWEFTTPMAHARRHLNLTVLPTGDVLATGGVGGTAFDDVTKGVHAAELWSPQTGQWTELASNSITRGYHGTTLLLPDGRLLNAGSGEGAGAPDERNAEIFSPPYLFKGPRPTISSAPESIGYGSQFRVETPDAASITHVAFIRLGAVTHAFDENQRFQRLTFTPDANGLTVQAPTEPNRAPPGHYMVFILNGSDVPSVAKIVRIN